MPHKQSSQRLTAIRAAFVTMRKRYIVLLAIMAVVLGGTQFFHQRKLTQIGITYEALNEIQQLYEVGSLLQPKGLMIVATQNQGERTQHIEDFSKTVDVYLRLYAQLRNNSEYHEVFAVSDTVKHRIFRLDDASKKMMRELPIVADSVNLDTTYNRIANILSVHNKSEQELNVFIMGYRQELQQMRRFLQWMSYGMIGFILLVLGGEMLFVMIPSRNSAEQLFTQAEETTKHLEAAHKTVTETRSRYELLVNQAHDCVYQLDTRGRFVFANNAATELLGYDNEMLAETYYLDYVHPDFKRSVTVEYLRQAIDDTHETMTFPIVDGIGKTHWIEQSFTKLYDNEMFVGYLGIARDITERREIQGTYNELANIHALVLENTASAVITTDLEGTITLFNHAAEYLLGYEASDIVGTMNIYNLQAEETLETMQKSAREALGVEVSTYLEALLLNAEHYGTFLQRSGLLTKHGNIVPVEMRLRLLKDGQNKTKGLLMTAQDITEQQHLDQIKQEFISRVSHEMRTPLHGIMGMIEVLRGSELTEEQRSMLDIAQSKSDVLLTLINDILEYSKIQSGTLEIQRVNSDMNILISNITEVLQHRVFSKGIILEINVSPETPATIFCDPVRLYQLLLSLSDNLMQFTSGGALKIDFDYLNKPETKDGLYISLYMAGGVVNADIQRKVFTPFVDENDNKEKFHPAGLQISLLRGIVQQMGGVLWLEQHSTKGSTFSIFLALEKEKLQAQGHEETSEELSENTHTITPFETNSIDAPNSNRLANGTQHETVQSKDIHILIIDDDEDNRNLAQTFLHGFSGGTSDTIQSRFVLHTATDGSEAVEAYHKQEFAMLLMDIQMPLMDGFEATKAIREYEREKRLRQTPIIAVTAHVMENYREKCLQAGMNDYLAKPVKKYQLRDMVQKWLENRKVLLLVDDSEDFRLVMKLQLEKEQKYNILVASDGREAIDLFQEHDVHAIIMDMEMPVLSGYEATRVIRQMPKGRSIPIYGMTGHHGEKELKQTLDAGCTQTFSKTGLETIKQVIATLKTYFEKDMAKEPT